MSTVLRIGAQGKGQTVHQTALPGGDDLDTRIALIQALIPLGLQAVDEVLQQEVATLAGPRYAREDEAPHLVRWGRQPGSVYLADQKLPIQVPRVRNRQAAIEVPLQSYTRLQQPRAADEGVLQRVLYGLSCRDYRVAAEAVPEAFGLSRSSVSRRYIRATARKLAALQERRLDRYDVVALVLDGSKGHQGPAPPCSKGRPYLHHRDRGHPERKESARHRRRRPASLSLRSRSPIQVITMKRSTRSGWSNLGVHDGRNTQQAYRRPTYETAHAELHRLHGELQRLNEDAAKSLAEGLEETLTLHRLGLADRLGLDHE